MAVNEKHSNQYHHSGLAKTNFVKVIVDAYYVQNFTIDRATEVAGDLSIVTIYKTDVRTTDLLNNLGIDMIEARAVLLHETEGRLFFRILPQIP